ncbi:PBP1A family penicillin-binding protein [Sphingomonas sp. MAH-20]|uniref:PBP1A family penicillin-binding protein n=1 Tax=Sphingomonas horti TaxID=2682842 RepID=A0A6I4J2H8_9SPHN|nr:MULTISPECIES: transglycosylase domain-containing protein [Sphingomonas]MBA2919387.1 penicillin-binding protein [Sphingomonas sp. CGMCC 1.13658]MVO78268.1 PBP1A family penicillin-binding protein [Sphingomonas horti]
MRYDEDWDDRLDTLEPLPELEPLAPDVEEPRPPRRRWIRKRYIAAGVVALFMLLVGWLAITAPLSRSLQPIAPPSITLVADDGTPIARRGALVAPPVRLSELPAHVPQAFIAIEDRRYYRHWGIDPIGIARAAWHNLLAGGVREGGSTITQQLAKGVFLSNDRSFGRKGREALIAFWLEAWLTKQEILERYLSNVYFGDNVYGIRAAARHYFSREPEELTLGQAAMLAGLVKAPSRLAPTHNLSGARARGRVVLQAMADAGFITQKKAQSEPRVRLKVRHERDMPTGTYFADWVMPAARDQAGAVYERQEIRTTLDTRLQKLGEAAVRRGAIRGAQMALVAMRPDGRVVAMVGGRDYRDSPFNRVTQARRQPGSTFKLFVYLAAIRAGMTPDSPVLDKPVTIDGWSPTNSDGRYLGEIPLRRAFARSSNVAAVRLADQVGRKAVIQAARDLGITSPLADTPSLALGTSGMTLLELTSAYAAVAGNNLPVRAYGLPKEQQGWIATLWNRPKRLSTRERDMLLDLLAATVERGTGRNAQLAVDAFGKTGTTQDARDAIFVGFAGDLVVGVWVGRDDNQPVPGLAGGGVPARVWRDFMSHAIPGAAIRAPEPVDEDPEPVIQLDENGLNGSIDVGPVQFGVSADGEGVTLSAQPSDTPPPPPESRRPPPEEVDPDMEPPRF